MGSQLGGRGAEAWVMSRAPCLPRGCPTTPTRLVKNASFSVPSLDSRCRFNDFSRNVRFVMGKRAGCDPSLASSSLPWPGRVEGAPGPLLPEGAGPRCACVPGESGYHRATAHRRAPVTAGGPYDCPPGWPRSTLIALFEIGISYSSSFLFLISVCGSTSTAVFRD